MFRLFAIDVPDERIVGESAVDSVAVIVVLSITIAQSSPESGCACGAFSEKRRADDTEATVVARLKAYHEQTAPLAAFYEGAGLFTVVDGAIETSI